VDHPLAGEVNQISLEPVQGVEEDEDADVRATIHVGPSQSALRMWLSIATS